MFPQIARPIHSVSIVSMQDGAVKLDLTESAGLFTFRVTPTSIETAQAWHVSHRELVDMVFALLRSPLGDDISRRFIADFSLPGGRGVDA
jgi:hypothetical protein